MKNHFVTTLLIVAAVATTACATTSSTPASGAAVSTKPNPNLITTAEIDATPNLRDAYDAVQRLRPTWITKSQESKMSISGNTQSIATLVVYLDNARLGDLDSLHEIQSTSIASIQFMDAPTATATLPGIGSMLVAGAIVIHSRGMR